MTLSADRALAIRATFSRLVLLLRADDRERHAADVIERITALGFAVEVSEIYVTVRTAQPGTDGDLEATCQRHHTQWLLTLQACLSLLHAKVFYPTRTQEVSE